MIDSRDWLVIGWVNALAAELISRISTLRLHTTITTAQTLTPNNIKRPKWHQFNPTYFTSICVKVEGEEFCHPSLFTVCDTDINKHVQYDWSMSRWIPSLWFNSELQLMETYCKSNIGVNVQRQVPTSVGKGRCKHLSYEDKMLSLSLRRTFAVWHPPEVNKERWAELASCLLAVSWKAVAWSCLG